MEFQTGDRVTIAVPAHYLTGFVGIVVSPDHGSGFVQVDFGQPYGIYHLISSELNLVSSTDNNIYIYPETQGQEVDIGKEMNKAYENMTNWLNQDINIPEDNMMPTGFYGVSSNLDVTKETKCNCELVSLMQQGCKCGGK